MTGINGYMRFMGNNLVGLARYDSVRGEIKENLKLAMDSIKNKTLNQLLDSDKEYQRRLEEERAAYNVYEKTEFTEKQREVVDTLIAKNSEVNFDRNINEYMAGLLDAYSVLKLFGITNE